MENENDLLDTGLTIDNNIILHLKETAGWGKFLAVTGFIYSALIAAGAIFAASVLTKLSDNYKTGEGLIAGRTVAVLYLIIAGVIFFMSMYLFRFAKKTQLSLKDDDRTMFTEAFRQLKIYFRFAGIITAITLILSVLGLIGVIMATAFRG